MDNSSRKRVLIIGAGPAGKTAAIALRRVGIHAELYERVPEFRLLGVGFGLQTNAMRALLKLGIGSKLVDRSGIPEWQEMYSSKGRLLARLPFGELSRETGIPGMSILRRDFEQVLQREIDPSTIHLGHEIVGIEQDPDGVTAHFANRGSARGALLIGADGLHSAVRGHMLGESPIRYSGYTAWRGVATLATDPIPRNVIRMWNGKALQVGLFPLWSGAVYWAVTADAPQGGSDPPGGKLSAALEQVRDLDPVITEIIGATTEDDVVRADVCDRDPISKWTKGRAVLMGDAAHPTTPFLGQGLGLAVEDAVVLAKELALTAGLSDHSVIPLALQSYEHYRVDRAAQIVLDSRKRGEATRDPGAMKRAVQQRAMRMVPASKWRQVVQDSAGYEV